MAWKGLADEVRTVKEIQAAMLSAAKRSDAAALAKAVESGAQFKRSLDFGPALLVAAQDLDLECLRVLAPLAKAADASCALGSVCLPRAGEAGAKREPARVEAAKLLMPRCDVDAFDMFGRTALMAAVRADLPDLARELMRAADVGKGMEQGLTTALHIAAGMRSSRCLRDLVAAGDPRARDSTGATPLMVFMGDDPLALAELIAKSPLMATNLRGETAMELMLSRGGYGAAAAVFEAAGEGERGELLRRMDAACRERRMGSKAFHRLRGALFAKMEAEAIAGEAAEAGGSPKAMRM